MARSFLKSFVATTALSIAVTLSALAAAPTLDRKTPIEIKEGKGCFSANLTAGTLQACDVTLTQGPNTRITADHAAAKDLADDNNGEWELTDKVHIVFDDAVLDADSATVTFANDRLQKIHVKGTPSRFSHQIKDSARRNQGRAATIDYDARTDLLRLSGNTWYSNGSNNVEVETAAYSYNLNDSSISDTDQVKATIDRKTPIEIKEGKGCFGANLTAGTLTACDVTLTQGPNTRITAEHAAAKGLADDNNGEWKLTGKVHVEFDNAILDADSATAIFADDRLQKIHVKGTPSRFSHQLKDSARRNHGRAATIDYDAQTALLRLSGDTWYSNDSNNVEVKTPAYTYNLNDSIVSASDQVNVNIQPNKRVPPPRTPDRATSQ